MTSVIILAFGIEPSTPRLACVFIVLSFAYSGVITLADTNAVALVVAAVGIFVLCRTITGKVTHRRLVPVKLYHGDKQISLTALHDTGNMLRDPITGKPVLVVGGDTAFMLIGLSAEQLRNPVETMATVKLPGLRLIPYQSIDKGGLLLAMRLARVQIGSWTGKGLVAFAPEGIGNSEYQALTGGLTA